MMQYSVLISVYNKENPSYFDESLNSIFSQTILSNDVVLVCDGPLADELYAVIKKYKDLHKENFNVLQLDKNCGLGFALNEGLKLCKNELVARFDSDDISFLNRCEKQLYIFETRSDISLCSGFILEFEDSINSLTGIRKVPNENDDILKFSRKRNPFNHPAMMFRKSAVLAAGGYNEDFNMFEDYYLWVRMLRIGFKGYNIQTPIAFMRMNKESIKRRGGIEYTQKMLSFHKHLLKSGWSNSLDYCVALIHGIICLLPTEFRRYIYGLLHQQNKK